MNPGQSTQPTFNIRRSVQKLTKHRPRTTQRLLRKYSDRERRKARDLCHKISRRIVNPPNSMV